VKPFQTLPSLLLLTGIALGLGACNATDAPPTSSPNVGGGSGPDEQNPGGATPVGISAAWANDGGDKVVQEDHRVAANGAPSVDNAVWNGAKISVFGAKNEVVNFNLVLEAAAKTATGVSFKFDTLTGPNGAVIKSSPATASGVFDWTGRNIENFYVRYLQIKGLSGLSYEHYDERHIPKRMQRPWSGAGNGSGLWTDRPDHDKHYPDIAVPLEAVPTFDIAQGQNQSIWSDIYIPKDAVYGVYKGAVKVYENGSLSQFIPVELTVKNFALPDSPSAKTMVNIGSDADFRYTGMYWPNPGTAQGDLARLVRDRHFQLAHRHRIALIDGDSGVTATRSDNPSTEWQARLDGSLFTAAHGYAGPGVSTGNGIYSIGTFGAWSWKTGTQADMWTHTNNWESWFQANAPQTEHFLYLADESTNYAQTQQWAAWIKANAGVGKNLKSFATIALPTAQTSVPDLSVAASWFVVGDTTAWQTAADRQLADASKRYYQYNGKRPANGSFATEDDGVALRETAWAQYKKGIQRWFFWESTYYNDNQGGRGQVNVMQNANTFGGTPHADTVLGESGWNHSNGDGVLFYPGTDKSFPSDSYGLPGPIASLRLKHWRRGIQDVDYLTLAKAINPAAVQAIVAQMVPKAGWEYGVSQASDPTWVKTDISWSLNPDDWEAARAALANIITSGN
jgi:hypothetical protein